MVTIAVCDDDVDILQELNSYVKKFRKEIDQNIRLFLFHNGEELLRHYLHEFDIIILDIQMGRMNGVQIAKEIREIDEMVDIIFLTSNTKYVLQGYAVNAKNYLIKPLSYSRFREEMHQLVSKWKKDNEYMLIKNDMGRFKVYLNQIMFIETYERNTMIHRERDRLISYKTMKEHEEFLKNSNFFRSHSSYIVNLSFVSNAVDNEIKLISEDTVLLSKHRKKEFTEEWLRYLGDEI